MGPGNTCASVANVGIDEDDNGQYASHLGVGVAGGDHLEDIVVEVVQESVQVFLRYLPQLSGDIAEGGKISPTLCRLLIGMSKM